jgi:hypothetical protein
MTKPIAIKLPKRNPLVVVVMQKKTRKHKNKKREVKNKHHELE